MNNENITNIIEDNNNTECITSLGKLIIAFNYYLIIYIFQFIW